MTYLATKHTVYIVHWPELNVVKVGYSLHQRWRAFVIRGAVIVDLIEFDNCSDAYEFETVVDEAFRQICRLAFKSAKEAHPYLGNGGGGWRECFRLPEGVAPLTILKGHNWIGTTGADARSMAEHQSSMCPKECSPMPEAMHIQTDILTNTPLNLRFQVTLVNARAGVAKFRSTRGQTHDRPRSALATRGR